MTRHLPPLLGVGGSNTIAQSFDVDAHSGIGSFFFVGEDSGNVDGGRKYRDREDRGAGADKLTSLSKSTLETIKPTSHYAGGCQGELFTIADS